MIAEAIQEVQNLALRTVDKPLLEAIPYSDGKVFNHRIEPTEHGRKLGAVIEPFRPAKLEVSTLTGFIDAIKSGLGGAPERNLIHIEDYLTVTVKSTLCDDFGKRDTLLVAKYVPGTPFTFDAFYTDLPKFLIHFQASFFMSDPDGPYVIRLASNLTAQSSVHAADDGINQVVTLKTGEVKTAEHNLKPKVKLIPRATFDEISPVEREFLIRLRQSPDQAPAIALFAVDGTKWQGDNMQSIKNYLKSQLDDWQILA